MLVKVRGLSVVKFLRGYFAVAGLWGHDIWEFSTFEDPKFADLTFGA